MEREFIATVVRVEQKTQEIFLIELESAALKDANAVEIISASLGFDQTGASVGSRLAITIAAGDKVLHSGSGKSETSGHFRQRGRSRNPDAARWDGTTGYG